MTINHLNEVRAIDRAARQVGAQLPSRIVDGLAHLDMVLNDKATPPRVGQLAKGLAEHLGNPAALAKARKAAAAHLAAAEADAKIAAYLPETLASRLRGLMSKDAEAIADSFGVALSGDLETLTATAGRLPHWFKPEQAGSLEPVTFAAWSAARDAYDRISATRHALAPLYAGTADSIEFPVDAAASLRFAAPVDLAGHKDAYAFRDALMGRVERPQELASQGSIWNDGVFIPTALAHAGASFEWGTPSQVAARAKRLVAAMLTKPEPLARIAHLMDVS